MYYRPFYVDAGIRAYQNNSRNEYIELAVIAAEQKAELFQNELIHSY